ncbi:MAG: hypothetical protein WKG06_38230 [Segetibacter sp.]
MIHELLKFLDEIESKLRLGVFTIKNDVDIDEVKGVLQQYSSTFQ